MEIGISEGQPFSSLGDQHYELFTAKRSFGGSLAKIDRGRVTECTSLDSGICVRDFDIGSISDSPGTWSSTTAVPVPAAVWLFGSGLIGLLGVAKRKR